MDVIKGPQDIPSPPSECAVAIGNFDGVHLGHKKIIHALLETAEKEKLYPLILTFHPHPAKVLTARKIELLQTIEQRLDDLKELGVQMVVVISFDHKFAHVSPEEFVRTIISQKLKAKKVIVGENFRFGNGRAGDVSKLKSYSQTYGFSVRSIAPLIIERSVVSSSLIRELLEQGRPEKANILIGRPYEIEGTVIKGKSRGKHLGFPTANVYPLNEIIPMGVFISEVGIRSKLLPAVTHVGAKPTFNDTDIHIESYIMDFKNNLYGERIRIFFLRRIRNEKKFESPEALSLQIKRDLESAKRYFHR